MPRPKRSKVTSAAVAPRAGAASQNPTTVGKAVAEDIEDGSDEGKNTTMSVRRVPRTTSRRKEAETRVASTTKNTDSAPRNGRAKEAAENSGAEDADGAQRLGAGTPAVEMNPKESISPAGETSVFRRGRKSASRKVPEANDVVSSIESDLAGAPITLPRMENTILGQPKFRGRNRQRAPSILGKGAGAARARSSSMGLEMTGAGTSSGPGTAPGTAQSTRFSTIGGAPGTAQSIRFSAMGGNFRRRERQPSILGSNRKKMLMQREADQSDQGQDDEDADDNMDDFNDFNPDDESTPLNAQKTKTMSTSQPSSIAAAVSTSSNSRKRRKISEIQVPRSPTIPDDDRYGASSPIRPRPNESQSVQQSRSPEPTDRELFCDSPPIRSRPNEAQSMQQSRSMLDDDNYGASSPARPRPAATETAQQSRSNSPSATPELERSDSEEPQLPPSTATPELLSETNAPPRSSSPSTPPRANLRSFPQQGPAASRGRQILLATQDSPISSPPSLTHSPNYKTAAKAPTRKQAAKKAKAEAPLTTATLQNLLPQRRQRRARRGNRDEFDMPSSDDEEIDVSGLKSDDDELSHLNAPARRARTRTPAPGKSTAKTPASTKATAKKPVRKAKPTPNTAAKHKRTYGSKAANKENQDGDEEDGEEGDDSLEPDANETPEDENSQELEERLGKELKRLKRKFEAVDQWEMEFEDVQGNNSGDDRRMADAR